MKKSDFSRINTPKKWLGFWIATGLGSGLGPIAPGTWGTLAAIPLVYLTAENSLLFKTLLWLGLFLLGTWSAKVYDQTMETQDSGRIVIDEVVGYGIAAWTCGADLKSLVIAFFVFRFFDILKLPPVRQVDQWSHGHPRWSGFGVMADDVLAGIQALLVILTLQHYGVL